MWSPAITGELSYSDGMYSVLESPDLGQTMQIRITDSNHSNSCHAASYWPRRTQTLTFFVAVGPAFTFAFWELQISADLSK